MFGDAAAVAAAAERLVVVDQAVRDRHRAADVREAAAARGVEPPVDADVVERQVVAGVDEVAAPKPSEAVAAIVRCEIVTATAALMLEDAGPGRGR